MIYTHSIDIQLSNNSIFNDEHIQNIPSKEKSNSMTAMEILDKNEKLDEISRILLNSLMKKKKIFVFKNNGKIKTNSIE